jgi:hypothetical protein
MKTMKTIWREEEVGCQIMVDNDMTISKLLWLFCSTYFSDDELQNLACEDESVMQEKYSSSPAITPDVSLQRNQQDNLTPPTSRKFQYKSAEVQKSVGRKIQTLTQLCDDEVLVSSGESSNGGQKDLKSKANDDNANRNTSTPATRSARRRRSSIESADDKRGKFPAQTERQNPYCDEDPSSPQQESHKTRRGRRRSTSTNRSLVEDVHFKTPTPSPTTNRGRRRSQPTQSKSAHKTDDSNIPSSSPASEASFGDENNMPEQSTPANGKKTSRRRSVPAKSGESSTPAHHRRRSMSVTMTTPKTSTRSPLFNTSPSKSTTSRNAGSSRKPKTPVAKRNAKGETPLHVAAIKVG